MRAAADYYLDASVTARHSILKLPLPRHAASSVFRHFARCRFHRCSMDNVPPLPLLFRHCQGPVHTRMPPGTVIITICPCRRRCPLPSRQQIPNTRETLLMPRRRHRPPSSMRIKIAAIRAATPAATAPSRLRRRPAEITPLAAARVIYGEIASFAAPPRH